MIMWVIGGADVGGYLAVSLAVISSPFLPQRFKEPGILCAYLPCWLAVAAARVSIFDWRWMGSGSQPVINAILFTNSSLGLPKMRGFL